jgi:hypothetical protein
MLAIVAPHGPIVRIIERAEAGVHAYRCRLAGSGRLRIVEASRLQLMPIGIRLEASSIVRPACREALCAGCAFGSDCSRSGQEGQAQGEGVRPQA